MPMERNRYPAEWRRIATEKKESVGWVCEICGKQCRKPPHNPIISNDVVWKVENNEVTTGATSYKDFPKDQVFEINGSGFGCVMTSVELLKDVTERYGAPFTPLMGLGEDYAFCWRVAQIGRKMFCDSRIKCGHLGLCEYRGKDA